jgi:hypothetical protein
MIQYGYILDKSGNPLREESNAIQIMVDQYLAGEGNTVVLLGDSRMSASAYTDGSTITRYDYQGWFTALNQMLGGPFDVRANFATGGVTSTVVRNVQVPQVLAMATEPRYAFIDCGYNDAVTGRKYTDTIADITVSVAALWSVGIKAVLTSSIPGTTVGTSGSAYVQLCEYNRWAATVGAFLPGVVGYLDLHSIGMDPTTGVLKTGIQDAAGIHVNGEGAAQLATGSQSTVSRLLRAASPPFIGAFDATSQMLSNPRLTGSSSAGIAAGTTGTLPTKFGSARTGTATGVFSQVARPDSIGGTRTKIAHTGGARGDATVLAADNFSIYSYAPSSFYNYPDRIRPAVPNGVQYLVTNTGGYTAAVADPTATWSTVVGTTFTVNGNLNLKVVESIDIGDTVQLVTEVWMDSFTGGAAVYNGLFTLTGSYGSVYTAQGGFIDNLSTAYPTTIPSYQIIRSAPMVLKPTTQILNVTVRCVSEAGVTGNWYVGRMELQKYAA